MVKRATSDLRDNNNYNYNNHNNNRVQQSSTAEHTNTSSNVKLEEQEVFRLHLLGKKSFSPAEDSNSGSIRELQSSTPTSTRPPTSFASSLTCSGQGALGSFTLSANRVVIQIFGLKEKNTLYIHFCIDTLTLFPIVVYLGVLVHFQIFIWRKMSTKLRWFNDGYFSAQATS